MMGQPQEKISIAVSDPDQQWKRVRLMLRREFGDSVFHHWLGSLTLEKAEGSKVTLGVASPFLHSWVLSHYAERLTYFWRRERPETEKVSLMITNEAKINEEENRRRLTAKTHTKEPDKDEGKDYTDYNDLAVLDPRFTFSAFVVGKENELAFAASRRVAESESVPFNPLFLYGGVGLGKTHLMHAIAWHIRKVNPKRQVLYMTAEKFMYQFIRAVRYKDTMAFKEQYRNVDVLMIDDVQFISGRNATQEEFFHTFNAIVDGKRQVIISADKSPGDLEGIEERLRSRLGWGLVADIHPATYELRLGILQEKSRDLEVDIPAKVLEFLAHRITSNVRILEGALNKIAAHASLVSQPVTLHSAQEVLHDVLRVTGRKVKIEDIQKRVCEYFGVRLSEMFSDRRARVVARPRQVAMYLAKQLTSSSLPEIGRKFGNRDHTTVMHAVRRIEQLRTQHGDFDQDVELLRRQLSI